MFCMPVMDGTAQGTHIGKERAHLFRTGFSTREEENQPQ